MPRKPTLQPRHADLRPEQMRDALPRLRKRIAELKATEVDKITDSGDPAMAALEQKVISTLSDIFGADAVEFQQFGYIGLYPGGSIFFGDGPSLGEIRQTYRDGVTQTISSLETIVSLFEGVGDPDSTARARRHFTDLDLHPEIARAAAKLFRDGHYANAIEDARPWMDS